MSRRTLKFVVAIVVSIFILMMGLGVFKSKYDGIHELESQIDNLESKNSELELKIYSLEAERIGLESKIDNLEFDNNELKTKIDYLEFELRN